MKAGIFLRSSIICSTLLILAYTTIAIHAQTLPSSSSRSNLASGPKSEPDFSLSIDPKSVQLLTDDELNVTFDRMSAQYSKNAVLFNNIGAAYFERKMLDKAEAAIRRAIILNNHPAFLTNLSILYDSQKRIPEAISAAQRAISQAPQYIRGRTQLCELMVTSKQNKDAILCYGELSKLGPLDAQGQTLYALASLRSGDPDRAISLITPLVRGNQPSAMMCNVLGSAYYQKRRFSQAADVFKQGVEIEPDSANLRFNLAMSLTAEDNRAGALSQYSLMKEKNPALADQLYRFLFRDKLIYVDGATTSSKSP